MCSSGPSNPHFSPSPTAISPILAHNDPPTTSLSAVNNQPYNGPPLPCWIIDLTKKQDLDAPLRPFGQYREICVFSIPEHLFDVCPQAFTPRILRVGPGSLEHKLKQMGMDYHKKRLLEDMAYKHRKYQQNNGSNEYFDPNVGLLNVHVPISSKELIENVINNAGGISKHNERRSCYEVSTIHLDDDSWRDVLTIDAIFIAAWLYHFKQAPGSYFHDFFRGPGLRSYLTLVKIDFMLMDNQIPMPLLRAAVKTLFPLVKYEGRENKKIVLNHYDKQPMDCDMEEFYDKLPDLLFHSCMGAVTPFFTPKIFLDHDNRRDHVLKERIKTFKGSRHPADHILDYVYRELCGSKDEIHKYARVIPIYFPSASTLASVGVTFKPFTWGESDMDGLKHIRLQKKKRGWWCPSSWTLHLPVLRMCDYSTPMMMNLIAYETVTKDTYYLRNFVFVMNRLIQSEEDVDILKDRRILYGDVINNSQTVESFSKMSTDIDVAMLESTRKGFEIFMNDFYKYFLMRALGSIKYRFSRYTPIWVWISGALAFILLVFTAAQVGLVA